MTRTRLRILMVATGTPGIPPKGGGGLERVIYEPTKALSKLGHGVTLIDTASIEERDLEADLSFCEVIRVRYLNLVKLHSLPFKYLLHEFVRQISLVFYALALIPAMTRLCCSCKYDIIHVHNRYSYILQAHGSLPRIGAWRKLKWFYDTLFGYKLLRGASRVIALSRVEAEQYRRMGVPEEKIAIIPNGIDLSEYASLPPEGSFKKKFGIKEKEKIRVYANILRARNILLNQRKELQMRRKRPDGFVVRTFSEGFTHIYLGIFALSINKLLAFLSKFQNYLLNRTAL